MELTGQRLLVAVDSPIRIRIDIDRQQAIQLDAIAVVANVIDQLYRQLVARLGDFNDQDSIEVLLSDAWGMIDWVHRMDGLVERCRGMNGRLAFVQDYRNASALVENHRHAVQHLEGTIPRIAESGRAPWGHITWAVQLPPDERGRRSATLRGTGSSLIGSSDPTFLLGLATFPRTPIDYVSLYSADGEAEIGLTGQHEALLRFIRALEAAVEGSGPVNARGILPIREPD